MDVGGEVSSMDTTNINMILYGYKDIKLRYGYDVICKISLNLNTTQFLI